MDTTSISRRKYPEGPDGSGPFALPEQEEIFDPSPGSRAERLAGRSRSHRPLASWAAVTVFGYVVMAIILVGLGLLLTKVLAPGPVANWDGAMNRWFVSQRTGTLNSITSIGSMLGATFTVVGIAIVATTLLAIGRHWRQIEYLASALIIEVTVFLTATLVINRARPTVPRLDATPPTSSYPSGHTAAAIVLYVGLAVIASSITRRRLILAVAWFIAVLLPIFVGLSRLYRGMHHPTDVMASLVLAIGSLMFALLATRTSSAVMLMWHRQPNKVVPDVRHAQRTVEGEVRA